MSIYTTLPQNTRLSGTMNLSPEGEDRVRRFTMLAYSGAPVQRMFGDAVFQLSGIELPKSGRVPILLNHDENQIVGYADTVEMTDAGLTLSGVLSSVTEYGRQVAALADEGMPWEASVGLRVKEWLTVKDGETLSVNGRDMTGPCYVGKSTRLLEASFVPAGADNNTRAFALTSLTPDLEEAPDVTETTPEPEVDLSATVEALEQRLSAALAEIEELKVQRQAEAEVRHPGVGFVPAETREASTSRPTNLAELWEADVELRADFGNNPNAFASWAERHPAEAASLLETE